MNMPPELQDNPLLSPTAPAADESAPEASGGAGRASFAHQAVRFSLYAPILLMAVNLVLRESLGANHPGAKAFALISMLTIGAGFFLAIFGVLGGFLRFSLWTIFLGLFGTLLNGAILAGLIGAWTR